MAEMLSRDEILERMHDELFSVRTAFFNLMDRSAWRTLETGERVKFKWPDVLTVVTLTEWNARYEQAMEYKAACRRGDNPPMPSPHDSRPQKTT